VSIHVLPNRFKKKKKISFRSPSFWLSPSPSFERKSGRVRLSQMARLRVGKYGLVVAVALRLVGKVKNI
jgi:mRNA-degrading endonuclease RelE of RelBE toxin-antitoxin system